MAATIRIHYYRSAIGRSWRQKAIIRGLGLTKLQQVVERPDTPGFRGMVAKVPHLLRILDSSAGVEGRAANRRPGAEPRVKAARAAKGKA